MISNDNHVVFDLDDTLYKEVDFIRSAYIFISNYITNKYGVNFLNKVDYCLENRINFFDFINSRLKSNQLISIEKYLELYRFHYPKITLSSDAAQFIEFLIKKRIGFSIITDGRSISQRNKISALGIEKILSLIIISEETGHEKPKLENFKNNSKKNY